MNKKLILVLVIAVALVATWSFAMHSKKAPPASKKAQEAAEFTLEEMPALPHTGEVKRMDLKEALRQKPTVSGKTLTPTDAAQFKQHMMENSYQIPFDAEIKHITPLGEVPERALTECLVYPHDSATCCWLYVAFDDELWGWGAIKMKTWQDPQAEPNMSNCGYPIYPFAVKGVEVFIAAPTLCTLYCSFDIQDFDWYYNTPYPGATIYESPVFQFVHPGAYAYLGVALAESLCVYDRYFASWTFYNTDDYDPEDWGWCLETVWPDQDSCVYDLETVYLDYELGLQPPPPPDSSVQWHEIVPNFCDGWHQDKWVDNGDGILSECDTLYLSKKPEREVIIRAHIENVTRTLILKDESFDTFYVEMVSAPETSPWDTLYWEPVVAETCSYWHVIYPPELFCEEWHLSSIINGAGNPAFIDSCDTVDFTDTTTGEVRYFHVIGVATDLEVTYPIWGHNPPYDFGLNVVWDQGGTCGKSYWSYGYYWTIGYWWDVVCDLPGFGMGWPGAVRIRSWGKTVDQNDCPIPEEQWWQKESFFDYDEETGTMYAYAPCGVPDFPAYLKEQQHAIGPFDGPTALANCLWWMAAAEKLDVFWAEQDPPNPDDPWHPANVPFIINELAALMELGECGVTPEQFDTGLNRLVEQKVLWVDITEMQPPTWEYIEYNVRLCEDVILLLGFWYFDPDSLEWYRVGGHWVTVAGVDHINGMIKISDPDQNHAEAGFPGEVCSFEFYLPHDHTPGCHYDAGNLSHDIYPVGLQVDPLFPCLAETLLTIIDYPLDSLDKYIGHNLKPECMEWQRYRYPQYPVHVKIEFAKAISPIPPYLCETIWAYRGADMWTGMTKCNYGDLMARQDYGFYWDPYGLAGFDGSIILGNDPSNLAFFGGDNDPPGEFYPYGGLEYDFYMKDGFTLPDGSAGQVGVNVLTTSFFHNLGLDLDIDMTAVAFDDTVGYGAGNGVWDVYTITNTGTTDYTDLRFAIWYDWDLLEDAYLDMSGADASVSFGWIYNTAAHPDTVFGNLILTDGAISAERFLGVVNPIYVHPNGGWGWDRDSLWNVMNGPDHNAWNTSGGPDDMSSIMTTAPFDLPVDSSVTITSWTGEPPPEPARSFITAEMYFIGFFRGDANMDCIINPPDIVYTVNYVFKSGPPAKPFEDHPDCNCDGVVNAADIVYQVNYVFKSGPAPYDDGRFPEIPIPCHPGAFNPGHPLYMLCQ